MDARAVTRRAGWWLSFSSGHQRQNPSGPTLTCVPWLGYVDESPTFEVCGWSPFGTSIFPQQEASELCVSPSTSKQDPKPSEPKSQGETCSSDHKTFKFSPSMLPRLKVCLTLTNIHVAFREKSPALDDDSPYLSRFLHSLPCKYDLLSNTLSQLNTEQHSLLCGAAAPW